MSIALLVENLNVACILNLGSPAGPSPDGAPERAPLAFERQDQMEQAAGAEDPTDLRQHRGWVVDVIEHVDNGYRGEGRSPMWEPLRRGDHDADPMRTRQRRCNHGRT